MSVISKLGFCKYKIEGDNISNFTVPDDVINGKGINLSLDYTWTTTTKCTISLSWYPILLNDEGALKGTTLKSNGEYLKKDITLKLNETTISTSNKTLSTNSINNKVVDNINGTSFPLEFVYSYTPSGSSITYYLEIKTKIFRPNPYDENVVFTKKGIDELLKKIKNYPITRIEGTAPTGQQPYIIVHHGSDPNNNGTKIKVGSVITFPASQNDDSTGTFRVSIDGTESLVMVKGFGSGSTGSINLGGALIPGADNSYDIGTLDIDPNTTGNQQRRWKNLYITGDIGASSSNDRISNIYATTGNFTNLTVNGNSISATNLNEVVNGDSINTTTVFWRGDGNWSNTLTGRLILSTAVTGYKHTDSTTPTADNALFRANGNGFFDGNLKGNKVFGAVFNDYAEYRTTINLAPGHVVIDQDDGSLICSTARLQPGAQVISDTFGHSMGETDTTKTPLAVAGRVLVYTYQPRENYHAGMAVCSAPGGTVDIMTREEIRDYPDCIIGIVSEIPQYETWGSDSVKIDGRIWIKVK